MKKLYKIIISSGLFLLPLSFNFGGVDGTPIDILIGDFMIIFLAIFIFYTMVRKGAPQSFGLYFSFFFFCVFLALASAIIHESFSPLLSVSRFLKSTLAFLVGCYFGNLVGIKYFYKKMGVAAAVLFFVLLISDIIYNPGFPYGRWGGKIGNYDVYGFPNAAAGFYAIIVYFLLLRMISDKGSKKAIWASTILIGGCICTLSLSRNSAATFFLAILISIFSVRSFVKKYIYMMALIIASAGVLYAYMPYLISNIGLVHKLSSTMGDNPLSGRGDVWEVVSSLIIESPIFGYGFYSFSNYGVYIKTTHNMVLDLLFKMGVSGLIFYLIIIFRPVYYYLKFKVIRSDLDLKSAVFHYSVMLFLIFVSGFSQETLSYSTNQLLFLYMAGHLTQQCKNKLRVMPTHENS